jgi:hypothetical protein
MRESQDVRESLLEAKLGKNEDDIGLCCWFDGFVEIRHRPSYSFSCPAAGSQDAMG